MLTPVINFIAGQGKDLPTALASFADQLKLQPAGTALQHFKIFGEWSPAKVIGAQPSYTCWVVAVTYTQVEMAAVSTPVE